MILRTLLYVSLGLIITALQGCPSGVQTPEPTSAPIDQATDDKGCYIPPYNRVNGLVGENYTWVRINEGPQTGTIFCRYTEDGELRG